MKKSIYTQVMKRAHEIRKNYIFTANNVEVSAQSYTEAMRYTLTVAWAEFRGEETDITRGYIVDKRDIQAAAEAMKVSAEKSSKKKEVTYSYDTLAVNDYGNREEIIRVLTTYGIDPGVIIDWLCENGLETYFVNTDGHDLCAVDEDCLEIRITINNDTLTVNGEW